MAGIVELQDMLNRKEGSGKIAPASPLETRLYGAAGEPISSTNKLHVKAIDTDDVLASILAKLSSDPATQTTLAAILAKLSSDPATQTTLAAVLAKLDADLSTRASQATLADVKTSVDALAALVENGALKTALTGSTLELYVTDWDELPDASTVPLGATAQLVGTFDVRQSDGADWLEVEL